MVNCDHLPVEEVSSQTSILCSFEFADSSLDCLFECVGLRFWQNLEPHTQNSNLDCRGANSKSHSTERVRTITSCALTRGQQVSLLSEMRTANWPDRNCSTERGNNCFASGNKHPSPSARQIPHHGNGAPPRFHVGVTSTFLLQTPAAENQN